MTAVSSNQTVLPDGNIVPSGTGANRTVTITPTGTLGVATVTLYVSDDDYTVPLSFIYARVDPNLTIPSDLIGRPRGIFVLDSAGSAGSTLNHIPWTPADYDKYPTNGGPLTQPSDVPFRDGNIRDVTHATGYTVRLQWDEMESSTTPP